MATTPIRHLPGRRQNHERGAAGMARPFSLCNFPKSGVTT